ncbi:MAG: gliding motility-associated C-terminal domain-containing protein, partial [Phaeodactylibacter sp.]|nr:gliding motility-associated C-terminal domain-containing protein [Phaeodactylibacter sp.]
GDPTNSSTAVLLSSGSTIGQTIQPDSCLLVEVVLVAGPGNYSVIINDAGSLPPVFDLATDFPVTAIAECDYTNNVDQFSFDYSSPVLDLGPDISTCSTIVNVLDAGPGFVQYEWQDGNPEQTYTAFEPGTYWVTAIDSCGNSQTDTILINVDPAFAIDLGPDQVYCQDTAIMISVAGFDNYAWSPTDFLDCDTCATVAISPDSTTCYTLTATTDEGCQVLDSIKIIVSMPVNTLDTAYLCEGETLTILGMEISDPGLYSETLTAASGCDSTHSTEVIGLDTVLTQEFREICENETTLIFGTSTNIPGEYFEVYSMATGCDSTHVITLEVQDTVLTQESITICAGDSVQIFGNYELNPGHIAATYSSQENCDSTHLITLSWYPVMSTQAIVTPACQGSTPGSIEIPVNGGTPPFDYTWDATGATGNILMTTTPGTYSVTITDGNGCQTSITAILDETPAPDLNLLPFPTTCFDLADGSLEILNASTDLSFSLDGVNFTDSTLLEGLSPGSCMLTVADPNGCSFQFDFFIGSPPELILTLPELLQITLGESIEINGQSNTLSIQNYFWDPIGNLSCLDCLDPIAAPTETTLYTLTIVDPNGCTDTEQTLIEVIPNYELYIPNAFSPDFDGINDGFTLYAGTNVASIQELLIFDRWGELIFRNTNFSPNDPVLGWDGRFRGELMDAGIFVYLARVRFMDDHVEVFKGDVLLLR